VNPKPWFTVRFPLPRPQIPRPRIQLAERAASDTITVKAPRWSRVQCRLGKPRSTSTPRPFDEIETNVKRIEGEIAEATK